MQKSNVFRCEVSFSHFVKEILLPQTNRTIVNKLHRILGGLKLKSLFVPRNLLQTTRGKILSAWYILSNMFFFCFFRTVCPLLVSYNATVLPSSCSKCNFKLHKFKSFLYSVSDITWLTSPIKNPYQDPCIVLQLVLVLTWAASIEIFLSKRTRLHKQLFHFHRICLDQQHGHRFIVLDHQYGGSDIIWKCAIIPNNNLKDWGLCAK